MDKKGNTHPVFTRNNGHKLNISLTIQYRIIIVSLLGQALYHAWFDILIAVLHQKAIAQESFKCTHPTPVQQHLLISIFTCSTFFRKSCQPLFQWVEWPPWCPDLTPYDFWLWGYLYSKVYDAMPATVQQLQN